MTAHTTANARTNALGATRLNLLRPERICQRWLADTDAITNAILQQLLTDVRTVHAATEHHRDIDRILDHLAHIGMIRLMR